MWRREKLIRNGNESDDVQFMQNKNNNKKLGQKENN